MCAGAHDIVHCNPAGAAADTATRRGKSVVPPGVSEEAGAPILRVAPGTGGAMVILAPVPDAGKPMPAAELATLEFKPTVTVAAAPGVKVTVAFATTPATIVSAFSPVSMQVREEVVEGVASRQDIVLPAAVARGPGVIETEETLAVGQDMVHCSAAGCVPLAVMDTGSSRVVPGVDLTDARDSDTFCPQLLCAVSARNANGATNLAILTKKLPRTQNDSCTSHVLRDVYCFESAARVVPPGESSIPSSRFACCRRFKMRVRICSPRLPAGGLPCDR